MYQEISQNKLEYQSYAEHLICFMDVHIASPSPGKICFLLANIVAFTATSTTALITAYLAGETVWTSMLRRNGMIPQRHI